MTRTNAKTVTQSFTLHVGAGPEQVFPLLCPIREYDWVDGWECRMVHSESGVVEQGCIFVTDLPPEGRTIWVTTLHDPATRRVEFHRVTPESHVSRMAFSVEPEGAASTLRLSLTFTALDERGASFLASLDDGRPLAARAARLERSLDHFLRTGAMLKLPGGDTHG